MFHLLQSFGSQHIPKPQSLSSSTLQRVFFLLLLFILCISFSSFCICPCLCDLQSSSSSYRQTKIASLWSYWLTLNTVINIYLKTYLQKFNSTALYMRDVNSSFYHIVWQKLTWYKLWQSWLIWYVDQWVIDISNTPFNYEQMGILKQNITICFKAEAYSFHDIIY